MYPDLSNITNDQISNQRSSNKMPSPSIILEITDKILLLFHGTKSKFYDLMHNCDNAINLIEEYSICISILYKIINNAEALIRNSGFESWSDLETYLLKIYAEKRTIGRRQLELTSC